MQNTSGKIMNITEASSESVGRRKVRPNCNRKPKPWFTEEIRNPAQENENIHNTY